MQGRTAYGGLTAALCLDAAIPLSGLKPVRCVQIAFVGPVSGRVSCTAELLREGKNTTLTRVRMTSAEEVLAEAIIAFGAARASSLSFMDFPPPQIPHRDSLQAYFREGALAPAFAANFDILLAGGAMPFSASDKADLSLWMRHRDTQADSTSVALMALADAPPPAAMALLKGPARISSMTWTAEFLTSDLTTEEGWYLARHTGQSAMDGYSSQAMTIWNSNHRPIMTGRQTIAIFD